MRYDYSVGVNAPMRRIRGRRGYTEGYIYMHDEGSN